ncbi:MATE family efflux transporter [Spirulina sp. CS-785/01]|uniref:MATE family efflux transporter n=1 Tax=Spirulina sp. CS-785/01 TaxID=3021716 RepID=UPI00232CBF92|nr:MATE family efflux transporter [Spirulina sp. CS-785/01]MDB9314760.1 MATE family efflux transporter [Spirulina sp. CS-785/01]
MSIFSSFWSEAKPCLKLALPLAAAQLSEGAINWIDTIMMGWLGSQTLAAGALGTGTFLACNLVGTGLMAAVGSFAAIAFGAGRQSQLYQTTSAGLWLTVGFSLPIMVLLGNMSPLLLQLGQAETNVILAQSYFNAILWGFPAAIGFTMLKNITSAVNQPRIIMLTMVGGILINVVGNYVLMFGKFGFPRLELAGLGWASTLAFWVKFLIVLFFIQFSPKFKPYHLLKRWYIPPLHTLRELLKVGIPSAVIFGVETGLFTCTTYIMGTLGTVALAAHLIALQTAATTFMIPVGIAYATTMRVGHRWGERDGLGVRRAGFTGIVLGAMFMGCMSILFLSFPRSIVGLYLDLNDPENQAVIDSAIIFLKIAGLFQLVDGIQVIANGALRGLKDTKMPLIIGLIAYWVIGLGSGYSLGILGQFGGIGLWWGLVLGLMTAAFAFTLRFHQQTQ